MSDQNKGSSQSQPVSAPESAARNSSAPMDMSKTTTPDLDALVLELPEEDEIVQLLFSVQRGAARLRPQAAKIMELYQPLLDAYAEQGRKLAACYRVAGADTDGDEEWRYAGYALEAVEDLRRDYEEAGEENHRQAVTIAALTAEAANLKGEVAEAEGLEQMQRDQLTLCQAEVERLKVALSTLAEPIVGTAVGDPWAFYEDARAFAEKALATQGEG